MGAKDTFRERLAAAIGEAGKSKQQTAADAGTYEAGLYRVLNGKLCPSLDYAERLAAAAGVELWELLAPADVVARARRRK